MESRFILGQQALTPDGAVYQIIWDMPYNEEITPDAVTSAGLPEVTPADAIAGSTCIFNTEDADGYPVEWLFAYDGTNWALDRVVRGGSAGGGGAFPEITIVGEDSSNLTYTSTVSYIDMTAMFDEYDGLVTLPVILNLPPMVTGRKGALTIGASGLVISFSATRFILMPDGTVQEGSK